MFTERTAKRLSWFGIVFLCLSALIFVIFRSWNFSFTLDEAKVGQFGDFVGGVIGSIFAFVGVILYYVALNAQREDIKINKDTLNLQIKALNQQIEEFKAQTEELQETRKVYEEQTNLYRQQTLYYNQQVVELKNQTKIAQLQRFEKCFYNLLNVFIRVRELYIDELNEFLHSIQSQKYSEKLFLRCDEILSYYEEYYYKKYSKLSRYFKTVDRLFKLIDSFQLDDEDKKQYAKILRSQLTLQDLLILYYAYFIDAASNIKTFAIIYSIFEDVTIFDKMEFDLSTFTNKSKLIKCLNQIKKVFDRNLKQYLDIEGDDVCITEELIFNDIQSSYGLNIQDDMLNFSISFLRNDWGSQNYIDETQLVKLIQVFLYDYFFLQKFNLPKDVLKWQKVEDEMHLSIEFIVNLNYV